MNLWSNPNRQTRKSLRLEALLIGRAVAAIPHGVPHAHGNTRNEPARFLGSGNPAGFERFLGRTG